MAKSAFTPKVQIVFFTIFGLVVVAEILVSAAHHLVLDSVGKALVTPLCIYGVIDGFRRLGIEKSPEEGGNGVATPTRWQGIISNIAKPPVLGFLGANLGVCWGLILAYYEQHVTGWILFGAAILFFLLVNLILVRLVRRARGDGAS